MPPSHLAARTTLALLLAATVVALVFAAADTGLWHRLNDTAQELWAALRATTSGLPG